MQYSQYLTNYGDGIGRTLESKYKSAFVAVNAATPFTSSISNGQTPGAKNPHIIWHEVNPDVGRLNSQIEGVQWSALNDNFKSLADVTVRQEYVQQLTRGYEITDMQSMVTTTSVVGDQDADAAWNLMLGLRTDHERVALSNQSGSAGAGTGNTGVATGARLMTGYFGQIADSTDVDLSTIEGSDTDFDIGNAIPDSDLDPNAGTLYHVDTVARKIWENGGYDFDGGNNPEAKQVFGGNTNMILANAQHTQGIEFSMDRRPNNQRRQDVGKKLAYSIAFRTYFATFGGEFEMAPSKYILGANDDDTTAGIAIFNSQNWSNVLMKDINTYMLGKEGSTQRYMADLYVGLMHNFRGASGSITGLTKSGFKTSD